jgi:hypothetical protein
MVPGVKGYIDAEKQKVRKMIFFYFIKWWVLFVFFYVWFCGVFFIFILR